MSGALLRSGAARAVSGKNARLPPHGGPVGQTSSRTGCAERRRFSLACESWENACSAIRPASEMQRCYIVDSANAPWKRSSTEGITFACQVLLEGEDGGPEALRFRFDACPSVYAHMHLTAQFQLLLSGTMDFPRGVKHLQAPAIHYTDHNMPYGPFAVSAGHDMLVLHPRAGGIISMANLDAVSRSPVCR